MKLGTSARIFGLIAAAGLTSAAMAQQGSDLCANAVQLTLPSGGSVFATGTTVGANVDGTGTCATSAASPDVWYKFTVPANGDVVLDTCTGSNYDTALVVFSACGGTQLACDDDACGNLRSRISLTNRTAGTQLWVRVTGFNGITGTYGLTISHVAATPPTNDLCANAIAVNLAAAGATYNQTSNTTLATADGTGGCTGSGNDTWYSVTCGAAGNFTVNTCGASTNFDTVLSLHSGCPGTAANQIACDDDGCGSSSTITRPVTAGQQFLVRVSGSGGASGTYQLAMSLATPALPPNPSIGPDVIVNQLVDVTNWGTDGAGTTAFSVGTDSCNPGDYPVLWIDGTNFAPDYDQTQHPVIGQNMYRLKSYGAYSRFEHLGQSWLKHGFVSTNSGACGGCTTTNAQADNVWRFSLQAYQDVGGEVLGLACSDTYGSGLNGSQSGLGAKNIVNPALGTSPFVRGNGTGNATTKERLQVPTADVTGQPAGTRFFVDGQYMAADDAQFVRPGSNVAVNALNNASWREIAGGATAGTAFVGNTVQQQAGIFAWKSVDPTVTLVSADHDDTPNPCTGWKDPITNQPQYPAGTKFIRSRYWVAAKVTSLSGGLYRYEYAVYNMNSDRACNSFSVAFPDSASTPTGFTFHAPAWHSGEPYSNAPWTMSKGAGRLSFAIAQPYNAASDTANAMRWGQLFNFGFTSEVAPTTGSAQIGLFKPGTIPSIDAANLPVPTPPVACPQDFNHDGNVDPDDLGDYITCFFTEPPCPGADFNGDSNVDPDDLGDFITAFFGPAC